MAIIRIKSGGLKPYQLGKFGLLFGASILLHAAPSFAGFELVSPAAPEATPATTTQSAQQPPVAAMALDSAPMPVVAAEPVISEPLTATPPAVPATPAVVSDAVNGQPVYIRRQRTEILNQAPANQPMDMDALLKATARNQEIRMVPVNTPPAPAPVSVDEHLVINPYPLQDNTDSAVHNSGVATPSVEQAMMEESGRLRPVAVPGQTSSVGMAARAAISGRYSDGSTGYLALPESYRQVSPSLPSVSRAVAMTPIPGGEDAPLPNVSQRVSLDPTPITPSMPRPAVPEDYPVPVASMAPMPAGAESGFTDAVGFGRDLPLPLALSQVIPPGYSYAFGQNVDLAANVSWKGGKPWNAVLNDMLNPTGMVAVIRDHQVTIQKARS